MSLRKGKFIIGRSKKNNTDFMLKGKHILLGITGSIAAYKAAMLIRLLVKEGAEVKVVMTEMAKQFITPLTMATLSKNPVLVEFYNPENGDWNSHISLGSWADLYIIAPASANTIAKMATGVADNLLLTTYLSLRCPVMIAPAMDLDMYAHKATRDNLKVLENRGAIILEPASGELASGLEGKGRMEEPENILYSVEKFFYAKPILKGKKILVTAGPTREMIDPVRYISNFSTGKMGYEIADAFALSGGDVTLLSGPTSLKNRYSGIKLENVVTSQQMYDRALAIYEQGVDIVVLCAAVSDFTPSIVRSDKIKRGKDPLFIELVPTQDIAGAIGKIKNGISVGFALETSNEIENAKEKLSRKNLDMIVLNSLQDKGAGFAGDTNKVTIIFSDGNMIPYSLKSKSEVAMDIVENVLKCFKDA